MTKARLGEKDRPWCAGAGSGALATGLTEYVWIFERIHKSSQIEILPTFDFNELVYGKANLFIWEAMVTRLQKGDSHADDAEIASGSFWDNYSNIDAANAIKVANPFSLVGAGLLRARLTNDIEFLFKSCIVLIA